MLDLNMNDYYLDDDLNDWLIDIFGDLWRIELIILGIIYELENLLRIFILFDGYNYDWDELIVDWNELMYWY